MRIFFMMMMTRIFDAHQPPHLRASSMNHRAQDAAMVCARLGAQAERRPLSNALSWRLKSVPVRAKRRATRLVHVRTGRGPPMRAVLNAPRAAEPGGVAPPGVFEGQYKFRISCNDVNVMICCE